MEELSPEAVEAAKERLSRILGSSPTAAVSETGTMIATDPMSAVAAYKQGVANVAAENKRQAIGFAAGAVAEAEVVSADNSAKEAQPGEVNEYGDKMQVSASAPAVPSAPPPLTGFLSGRAGTPNHSRRRTTSAQEATTSPISFSAPAAETFSSVNISLPRGAFEFFSARAAEDERTLAKYLQRLLREVWRKEQERRQTEAAAGSGEDDETNPTVDCYRG